MVYVPEAAIAHVVRGVAGLEALQAIRAFHPEAKVVMVSGSGSWEQTWLALLAYNRGPQHPARASRQR